MYSIYFMLRYKIYIQFLSFFSFDHFPFPDMFRTNAKKRASTSDSRCQDHRCYSKVNGNFFLLLFNNSKDKWKVLCFTFFTSTLDLFQYWLKFSFSSFYFHFRITFPLAYAVFLIIFFAHKKFFANEWCYRLSYFFKAKAAEDKVCYYSIYIVNAKQENYILYLFKINIH